MNKLAIYVLVGAAGLCTAAVAAVTVLAPMPKPVGAPKAPTIIATSDAHRATVPATPIASPPISPGDTGVVDAATGAPAPPAMTEVRPDAADRFLAMTSGEREDTVPANTSATYSFTNANDVRTVCGVRNVNGRNVYSITKYADATVDIDPATRAQWVQFGCAARVARVRYDNSPEGKAKIEARIVHNFNQGLLASPEQAQREVDQIFDDLQHPQAAWKRKHCGADGDQPDNPQCSVADPTAPAP